jgi:hypothetical protein
VRPAAGSPFDYSPCSKNAGLLYDYELIPLEKPAGKPEPEEEKMSVLGFLALVFLSAILDLPEPEGSAIDEEGKIETPQST